MTGIVKNLEAKGLVSRRPSPDHARVMLVSLTPSGVRRAAAALALVQHAESALREAMTAEKYRELLDLLDHVTEVAGDLPFAVVDRSA